MTDNPPPGTQLVEAAQAIHADNLHLLDRLAADDCNPGIELDDTLNGAQDHIFRFFEALALYDYGTVPWRSVRFMLDSTEALVQAVEARFHMPSAHAVGRAFRASKIWWCVDEPVPNISRKAYLKNLFTARDSFYAALNDFNCDIFCQGSPPAAPTPPQHAATKSDIRAAVKTILRGEDVNAAKPGPRLTAAKRRQIEAAEAYRNGRDVRFSEATTVENIQKAVEEMKLAVCKAKREIIKDAHMARTSEADRRVPKGERARQIGNVRKIMREARAAGKRMSILRACRKAWQDVKGGYPSPEALYDYCHSHRAEF